MNAFEMICRVGFKGKNVPYNLKCIKFENENLKSKFLELNTTYKDWIIELLTTQIYDDMVQPNDGFGYGWKDEEIVEEHIRDIVLGEEYGEEAEDDEEAEEINKNFDLLKNFIEILNEMIQYDVSNIEIDLENRLIIVD